MYNEEYELLQNIGSFGLVEGLGFQFVHHKMGAGYRRSILIGSREGERYWRLIYKVLPGTLDGAIWRNQQTLQESRADYLWNLVVRCKTGYQDVNRPVRIKSPRDGKEYLAVFEDDFIEYEMFM